MVVYPAAALMSSALDWPSASRRTPSHLQSPGVMCRNSDRCFVTVAGSSTGVAVPGPSCPRCASRRAHRRAGSSTIYGPCSTQCGHHRGRSEPQRRSACRSCVRRTPNSIVFELITGCSGDRSRPLMIQFTNFGTVGGAEVWVNAPSTGSAPPTRFATHTGQSSATRRSQTWGRPGRTLGGDSNNQRGQLKPRTPTLRTSHFPGLPPATIQPCPLPRT